MLSFQQETLAIFWDAAQKLFLEHQEEVGEDLLFDPDKSVFEDLERLGRLVIITAREHGELVGYVVLHVSRHTFYKALIAFENVFFLRKASRKGRAGLNLLRAALLLLHGRGVKKVYFTSQKVKDLRTLYSAEGFTLCAELWTKVL